MLNFNIIDVHYLQNVVFSIGKGSDGQNHTLSDSHCRNKKTPHQNFPF